MKSTLHVEEVVGVQGGPPSKIIAKAPYYRSIKNYISNSKNELEILH